ncbi:hypothetical protein Dda3937_02930 [Dickeya dadantii 3937]|uniref:Uncharacterized protein n=1 Tax=Dickeya dadantii (strain 3937) TaxID=198628 RepID=E0SCQ4_DICD3|nr:hypothetical protein Dda3937_02930 [Dickeya dadantii 3937]
MPRHPSATTKKPALAGGGEWLLGERQAAGVMLDPVGGGIRGKGFNAQPFQTVPQLAADGMTKPPGQGDAPTPHR